MTTVTETPAVNNPATPAVPDAAALVRMLRDVVQSSATMYALMQELRSVVDLDKFDRLVDAKTVELERPAVIDVMKPPAAPTADAVGDDDDEADPSGTRTYHVYYVGETNRRRSARLDIVDDEIEAALRDHYHGAYEEVEHVGTVTVQQDALRFEIEAETMAAFGGHIGDSGRPAFARYCEAAEWDRIAGEVAVVLLTWPRFAPETPEGRPADAGPATAEAIAAATGRSLLDVRDAMAELRKQPAG